MSATPRTELSLSMTVAGVTFELVQFNTDFSINTIPTASVVLAIGRKATDGQTVATVHKEISLLKKDEVVRVYLCAKGESEPGKEWPEGPIKIFEGYVGNVGFVKFNGKISVSVTLYHWLSEIHSSSAISSLNHPSNPTEYTFESIISSELRGGTNPTKPSGLAATSVAETLVADNFIEDLWAKALKPMMCKIGKSSTARLDGDLKSCFGDIENNNDAVLSVLSRIEGGEEGDDCGMPLSCYTPKMALQLLSGDVAASVGDAIAVAIGQDTVQSFANQTLWNKMVGYAGTYGGAIVPQVDKALFVPFVPGVRETYCKTIQTCDYHNIQINEPVSQLLRGIALMGSLEFSAGSAPTSERQMTSLVGSGGCYVPDGVTRGMIKFVMPPPWLAQVAYGGHEAKAPVGIKDKTAFSSATTPQAEPKEELIANKSKLTREAVLKGSTDLYDKWARYQYMLDCLRGRFGTVGGRLRFDIAPGCNVIIAGSSEQFLQEQDALAESMIGTVMRVSIGINADSQSAGTTLTLSHLRTLEENADDKYSVDSHPLYDATFIGAPLIDELAFGNCCGE